MARHVRLNELLIGIEGLALLRHLYDGSDEDADRRLGEVRRLLDDQALAAGWHAPFSIERDERAFVREYPHTHADFMDAFRAAALTVSRCVEPRFGPEHVRAKRRAFEHIPAAVTAAYAGLPGVLVWELAR